MRTMLKLSIAIGLTASLCLSGCAKDPSKGVPAAKVKAPEAKPAAKAEAAPAAPAAAEAKPAAEKVAAAAPAAAPAAAAAAAAPAAAGAIALSGDVIFTGSKVTGSHECKFDKWTGSFTLADGKAEGGSLTVEIDMDSVVADFKKPTPIWSDKLTGHLKSPDFFDVKTHPKATFVSTSVKAGGVDGKGTHTIAGKLTIRGASKDVTFPATVAIDGGKIAAQAKFSINRKDFGIEYPGKKDDLIRDGVVLDLNFKG